MANNKISFNKFYTEPTKQTKSFVYKDLHAFKNKRTNIAIDIDIISIYNSLKNLMEFKKGQRILDINFGNPLYSYLYESMTTTYEMELSLREYIEKYEPRIQISRVDITRNEEQHELYLNINYTILNEDKFTDNFSIIIGD